MYRVYNSFDDMIGKEKIQHTKKTMIEDFAYYISRKVSQTFIVEDYIESEWRDMYSIYYGQLPRQLHNYILRIHFISVNISSINDVSEDNYKGYITLRPIYGKLALSRVRLKYDKHFYHSQALEVITHQTEVNFPHKRILYHCFPFFRQDGMVTVCAHADMHMLIKTMHSQHHFNHYGIANILNKIDNKEGRDIPTEGLSLNDMVYALKMRGFNPLITSFQGGYYELEENGNKIRKYSLLDFLDTMVASALPAILAYDGHVILLAGKDDLDRYIFFDDSGAHLSKLKGEGSNYSKSVSKEEMMTMFTSSHKECFVLVPTFKSFFFRYKTLREILENDTVNKKYFGGKKRIILTQSTSIKQYLVKNGITAYANILLPKYVWYIELYRRNEIVGVCLIDASSHQYVEEVPFILGEGNKKFAMKSIQSAYSLLKEMN